MAEKPKVLTTDEIAGALAQLPDWTSEKDGIATTFSCQSAAAALTLIASIGEVAESLNHHPDVDWRYDKVVVRTTTHESGGVSERDVVLAERISALAAVNGAKAR